MDITRRKRAEEELRRSRSRLVDAADAERRRLERNLHDGAQQRLVSLSLALRLAEAKLRADPEAASTILGGAGAELALALQELRELARGLHPAILTDRGLAPALETLAERASVGVELEVDPDRRLPGPVEVAIFYVVSESLANVAKHADASASHRASRAVRRRGRRRGRRRWCRRRGRHGRHRPTRALGPGRGARRPAQRREPCRRRHARGGDDPARPGAATRDVGHMSVTLLFTDIEGSTRLVQKLGDGYAAALEQHRAAVRAALAAHGGEEIDCRGDEFSIAFADPAQAVAAAEAIQEAPVGTIRVRIGIHTGEPIRIEGGYVGLDVHRAARICAAGHGGQVLLSQATAALLGGGAAVRDLGEHQLRGVDEPERLHQLGAADFPALRADAAEVGLGARTRIVLADDSVLLREGIARLLEDAGFEIVGQAGNADELMLKVRSYSPDVAIVDIRMPPTHTDEGLVAAGDPREASRARACSSCPRTSSPATRSSCCRGMPRAWATCSRTGCRT